MQVTANHDKNISELFTKQATVDARLDAISKDISQLTDVVGELAGVMRSRGQTPWNQIFGAMTIFAVVFGGFFGYVLQSYNHEQARIVSMVKENHEFQAIWTRRLADRIQDNSQAAHTSTENRRYIEKELDTLRMQMWERSTK